MRGQETVSSGQMAVLLLSFSLGSAIIYIPNLVIGLSENAAWLALALSMPWGMLVLASTLYLSNRYPNLTFIEYSFKIAGKWITFAVGALFAFMLLTMLVYIIISIGGFFVAAMMNETPSYVFNSLTLLLAAFTVRAGIETIARLYSFLIAALLIFVLIILILAVPYYHPELLLPLFPDGWRPLLHGTFYTAGFPYAEVSVFSMLLPFVRTEGKKKSLRRSLMIALSITTLTLILSFLVTIMVLGPLAAEREYSLYAVAQVISIYDILERIESIVGIVLIVGSYMKAVIALFILNLTLTKLFRLQDDKILIFPLASLASLLSETMYSNEMGYVDDVAQIWPLMALFFGALPVLLMAVLSMMKGKRFSTEGSSR